VGEWEIGDSATILGLTLAKLANFEITNNATIPRTTPPNKMTYLQICLNPGLAILELDLGY
jgi:hypothetical protein